MKIIDKLIVAAAIWLAGVLPLHAQWGAILSTKPPSAPSAPNFVRYGTAVSSAGTATQTFTLPASASVGQYIVIVFVGQANSTTESAISDSAGNSYSLVANGNYTSGGLAQSICFAAVKATHVVTGGTTTLTVTYSATTSYNYGIYEYVLSGITTGVDKYGEAKLTQTSVSVPIVSGTTVGANVCVGLLLYNSTSATTSGSSWTNDTPNISNSGWSLSPASFQGWHIVNAASGSPNPSITLSASVSWVMLWMDFY